MKEQTERLLYEVAEDVLGKLTFVFSFPDDDRPPLDPDAAVSASVSFDGPFSGTLFLTVTAPMLPELTGNMLGVEEGETTVEQQEDALKELINVICGNFLPRFAGKQAIFHVAPPRIAGGDEPADAETAASAGYRVQLSLDEGACDLHLTVRGIPSSENGEDDPDVAPVRMNP